MGKIHKHPGEFKLRIGFFSIFFCFFFFFSAKMNLTVFAGILLAVTMATARTASLVEKIMRAADEADEPAGAKRANGDDCPNGPSERCECPMSNCDCPMYGKPCESDKECCEGGCWQNGEVEFKCWW